MSDKREAEELYTIAEAAAKAKVGQGYIHAAIKRTEPPFLRAFKMGRGYRIKASDFNTWVDQFEDA